MSSIELRVTISRQTVEVWRGSLLLQSYPVSTSKFGIGNEEGSFRTPLGRFEICEKYGEEQALHTIFKARKPIGKWNPDEDTRGADLILSRILRLNGLEEKNANSFQRYIYIHGTNHEDKIGSAASNGCVRMTNRDIGELYDLVPLWTPVLISAS